MKRYLYLYIVALVSLVVASCTHHELVDDARRYHINLHADYRFDWEDTYEIDWKSPGQWPQNYKPYNDLRPTKPSDNLVIYDYQDGKSNFLGYISGYSGVIRLSGMLSNLLIYNDSEYNIISYDKNGTLVRATTRTKTRASFTPNKFADPKEETKKSPDMLFANYHENFDFGEKTLDPVDFYTTLQPLVFSYYIRIPIKEGLKYVRKVGHTGDLSGVADGVNILNGETLNEAVTILFDNTEDYGYDVIKVTDWGIEAVVRSYGLPGYPNVNYPTRVGKNGLGINIYLTNGKVARFECDVTEQMSKQPHGGVIEWTGDDIIIEKEAGEEGSGAFDVEVDDWEYEDIPLPL